MDNFRVDVTAEGKASLKRMIEVCFDHNGPGKNALSYSITVLESSPYNGIPTDLDKKQAFVLRWKEFEPSEYPKCMPLPCKLDATAAADFVALWLSQQDYGPEPDHDGSNGKGWRMFVGPWGHIQDDRYAICAIIPNWAWYGK